MFSAMPVTTKLQFLRKHNDKNLLKRKKKQYIRPVTRKDLGTVIQKLPSPISHEEFYKSFSSNIQGKNNSDAF